MGTEGRTFSTTAPTAALIGRVLGGRYKLTRYLAKGGMGAVFEAMDTETDTAVAVKLLTVETGDQLFRRRFFNEAAMAASLKHPNAVKVTDFGSEDDGTCFMVMELLEGEPFNRYLRRVGPLGPEKAIRVARDICDVLAEAHGKGFIHRDLKPSNLYCCGEDEHGPVIKVLDFGLAKRVEGVNRLTMPGMMLGSPKYMSPEQLHGVDIGPATDIYNVGLLLFRMLVGKHAFIGRNPQEIIIRQATRPPPKLSKLLGDDDVTTELEWVVETCLKKDPEDRFANIELLRQALAQVEAVLVGDDEAIAPTLHTVLPDLDEPQDDSQHQERLQAHAMISAVLVGAILLLVAMVPVIAVAMYAY